MANDVTFSARGASIQTCFCMWCGREFVVTELPHLNKCHCGCFPYQYQRPPAPAEPITSTWSVRVPVGLRGAIESMADRLDRYADDWRRAQAREESAAMRLYAFALRFVLTEVSPIA